MSTTFFFLICELKPRHLSKYHCLKLSKNGQLSNVRILTKWTHESISTLFIQNKSLKDGSVLLSINHTEINLKIT